jgi:hypothetical protein
VTAADLQYTFAAEVCLRGRAVVQLDEEPIGLVGGRKRQSHRRILLVAVVEEDDIVGAEPASDGAINKSLTHVM